MAHSSTSPIPLPRKRSANIRRARTSRPWTASKEIPLEKIWAYQMPGTHAMEMTLAADGKAYATAEAAE